MARFGAGATVLPVAVALLAVVATVAAAGGDRNVASHGEGANLKVSPGPLASAPAGGSAGQFRGQARLPRFAAPRRYELHLRPDLVACTFSGSVAIDVSVSASTRFLVLNTADLSINSASIRFQALAPTEVVFFKEDDVVVLEFAKQLPVGEGVLKMDFNGTLNDQLRGFYRSKYQYKGKERNMAVTQFEPVDARRCFPCWDEPAFKAKFKLTLEVPSELVALSNMPVANTTVAGPIKTVHYQESPLMSTYLVAIVVGFFEYVEGVTSKGTRVRVYTQVGKSSQGKFALDIGVKSLDLYKDYFGTPYPLPKLDMVAIPDFSAGAMENYGLVTFREVALLFDEKSSSASSKQNVAITVAHELAHQWFGNLVTMEWWTHLWLNEGFATWVSHLAVDSFFPQWNIWTQFLDSTTSALKLDSLEESHPIEVEIHHASEIDEIFDAISYDKGASLIRMVQSYLGADRFQKALATYIKKYAYSNAKTEDLWAVLEKETGEPVKDLMSTWTKQKGYPVINAKLKGNDMELDQVLARRLLFGKEHDKLAETNERRKKLNKFKESAWKFVYHLSAELLTLSSIYNEPWFTNTRCLWVGPGDLLWPDQKIKLKLKVVYMYATGFNIYSTFSLLFRETRRKDFEVMMSHHVCTVILIVMSYIGRHFRHGSVTLALHATSDIFLEAGKMAKYSGCEGLAIVAFLLFVASWIFLRLIIFPFWIIGSTSYEVLVILDKERQQIYRYYATNSLLSSLLFLHIYWSVLIYRMLLKQILRRNGC